MAMENYTLFVIYGVEKAGIDINSMLIFPAITVLVWALDDLFAVTLYQYLLL